MAKLATQTIVIQLSKAVADSEDDAVTVIDEESVTSLREAVEALADGSGAVVELANG